MINIKGDKQLDYNLIKKKILNKDSVIMSIIMSRISLLISQLTSSYGERPIITPPSFMTSKIKIFSKNIFLFL